MSRQKGHNFERRIAKEFREIGFNTRTTRAASNLLDSCGVDIVGTPFIIQCKSGYMRARPKFEQEYQYIKERLTTEFGENHQIHRFPIIIIHELDVKKRGRGQQRLPEETYVMISFNDFINMIEPTEQNSSKDPEGPIYDVLDIM